MQNSEWTLDGREQTIGPMTFIVRSCPVCRAEKFAPSRNRPALDGLREWAIEHTYLCQGNLLIIPTRTASTPPDQAHSTPTPRRLLNVLAAAEP